MNNTTRRLRAGRVPLVALLVAAVVLATASVSRAQCALDGCTSQCNGGCSVPFPIQHESLGTTAELGSFDLRGTMYDSTCALGSLCPAVPPLRFWAYDQFLDANSGCQDRGEFIVNGALDLLLAHPPGLWFLYQANWASPAFPSEGVIDGCIADLTPLPPTVVE